MHALMKQFGEFPEHVAAVLRWSQAANTSYHVILSVNFLLIVAR